MNRFLIFLTIILFIFSTSLMARKTGGRSGSRFGFSKRKQIRKNKINRVKTSNGNRNRNRNRNYNNSYNNTNRSRNNYNYNRNYNNHRQSVRNVIRHVNNARIINHEINRNRRINNRNRRLRRYRRRNIKRYRRMTLRMKQRIFINKVIKNKKGKRIDCQKDVGSWKWFKSVNRCMKKRGVKYE